MKRVLVVANRTLCEQHLLDAIRARREVGAAAFHLLVPASHPPGTWTDAQAGRDAGRRLEESLETLRIGGIAADGEVGDASPVNAVADVLRREPFDEIIVSTLPRGVSRWLGQNVLRRMAQFGLPVTHVVAEPVASPT
jgi:hypothetical protein